MTDINTNITPTQITTANNDVRANDETGKSKQISGTKERQGSHEIEDRKSSLKKGISARVTGLFRSKPTAVQQTVTSNTSGIKSTETVPSLPDFMLAVDESGAPGGAQAVNQQPAQNGGRDAVLDALATVFAEFQAGDISYASVSAFVKAAQDSEMPTQDAIQDAFENLIYDRFSGDPHRSAAFDDAARNENSPMQQDLVQVLQSEDAAIDQLNDLRETVRLEDNLTKDDLSEVTADLINALDDMNAQNRRQKQLDNFSDNLIAGKMNPETYDRFYEFAKKAHANENIDFLSKMSGYTDKGASLTERREILQDLFDAYPPDGDARGLMNVSSGNWSALDRLIDPDTDNVRTDIELDGQELTALTTDIKHQLSSYMSSFMREADTAAYIATGTWPRNT